VYNSSVVTSVIIKPSKNAALLTNDPLLGWYSLAASAIGQKWQKEEKNALKMT
jgi:hypothetical protein